MAIFKSFIEIQGGMFDIWDLKSITKRKRYDDKHLRMEYLLMINEGAISKEYRDVEISYTSEEKRDKDYARLKRVIEDDETMRLLVDEDSNDAIEYADNDEIDNPDEEEQL